ncbi:MAG: hypothetical protein AB2L26_10560 [Ignavibacteria bacterium]
MKLLYSDENFDFPVEYFRMPENVVEAQVCSITGMLANSSCPSVTDLTIINKKLNNRKCSMTHEVRDSLALPPISNDE